MRIVIDSPTRLDYTALRMASGAAIVKRKRLSGLERKFVKHLCSGATLTDAAKAAGYSPKNAGQSGHQAIKHISAKIPEIMDMHGLTANVLIEKYLKPALEAHETKFFADKGIVCDQRDVIAWGPRLNALDAALKLRGAFPREESQDSGKQAIQVVVISADTRPPIEVKAIESNTPDQSGAVQSHDLKVIGTLGPAGR